MNQIIIPLNHLFKDQSYAWKLIEAQANLQTYHHTKLQQLPKLLQLYMKGVQILNSSRDKRQSFFRNKLSNLLMQPTVIKSMNEKQKVKTQQTETEFQNELNEKRNQMLKRLAYDSEAVNIQNTNKLIAQHLTKSLTLNQKIEEVIEQNKKKIEQRLINRKLKKNSLNGTVQNDLNYRSIQFEMDSQKKVVLKTNQIENNIIPKSEKKQNMSKMCYEKIKSKNNLQNYQKQKKSNSRYYFIDT